MKKSERIIWRVEAEQKTKELYPKWNKKQINRFVNAVEASLEKDGFFN